MARALSQVYTIIRGSVGGLTYLANQFHQIVVRARTAPVQPGTVFQTAMKTAFSAAEALWSAASQATLDAWSDSAQTVIRTGPLGNYSVKNRQQFLSTLALASYLNTRFALSIPVSDDAPSTTGWLKISNFNLAPPGSAGTGFAVNVANDEDHEIIVYVNISPAFNATKNFYKGPWISSRATTFSVASQSSGTEDIINLIAGRVYFIKIRAISITAEHRISTAFIARGVAATTI